MGFITPLFVYIRWELNKMRALPGRPATILSAYPRTVDDPPEPMCIFATLKFICTTQISLISHSQAQQGIIV